jgi:hypothetical protein
MFRRLALFFLIGFSQAALAIGMAVIVFGSEMSRFGSDSPTPPGIQIANAIAEALAYPLVPLFAQLPLTMQPSGLPWEHLTFLANGLIWAAAILALRRRWRRRIARKHADSPV